MDIAGAFAPPDEAKRPPELQPAHLTVQGKEKWGDVAMQVEHKLLVPGKISYIAGDSPAFGLQDCPGFVNDMEHLLRPSNVGNIPKEDTPEALAKQVVAKINGGHKKSCAVACCWGRLVPEGNIQFIEHSGRTEAVSSGRWLLCFRRASWAKIAHLSETRITYGNVTIVWIQRCQLGLAWESGREVVLDAGLHVYNDPSFIFERVVDQNADYIQHGSIHVVRVAKGRLAKAWVAPSTGGSQPRLLAEGLHVIESSLFTYEGSISVMESNITHGTLFLVRVPQGHVGKIANDGMPHLLGHGFHFFENSLLQYTGLVSLSEKVIHHGTITLVRVSKGEVAVAWLNTEPLVLEAPGLYGYDDPDFSYVRHQPLSDKIISLGAKKLVTVREGEICISHQHGALRVLEPGRHMLEDATHTIDGFLPKEVQQNVKYLNPSASTWGCCSGAKASPTRIGAH